jgi:hypothetical protein
LNTARRVADPLVGVFNPNASAKRGDNMKSTKNRKTSVKKQEKEVVKMGKGRLIKKLFRGNAK